MRIYTILLFLVIILQLNSCTQSTILTQNGTDNNDTIIEEIKYDFNDSDILEQKLGPRKRTKTFQIGMSVTYTIIFICGLIGNLCACCVIICNNCMHTTTNYYLFSLAVSDVLSLSIGLPPELYSIVFGAYPWIFGNAFCVIRTFIFEATTVASVLTILAFTFERWLHVCYPMFAQKFSSSFGRAIKIILLMWILSAIFSIPFAIGTGAEEIIKDVHDSILCKPLDKYQKLMTTILLLSSILLFIVPMTLISIMYISIGLTLWRPALSKTERNDRSLRRRLESILKFNSKSQSAPEIYIRSTTKSNATMTSLINGNKNKNISDPSLCNDIGPAATQAQNTNKPANDRRSRELEYISYRTRQSRRDVVKMLFVLVICFFLCWAPHHLQRIMTFVYAQHIVSNIQVPELMMNILEFLYYTSGILIYISSTINPILYNVMSKRYRTAFKNTVTMCFTCSFNTRLLAYKRSNYYFTRVNAIHRNNHNPNDPHQEERNILNNKNSNSLYNKQRANNNITNNTVRGKKPCN